MNKNIGRQDFAGVGPLLTVEIYGTKKVDMLAIFLLSIYSLPSLLCSVPQEVDHSQLHQLLLLSSVLWCPFVFGQWKALPEITVRQEFRAFLPQSLSAPGFQFWKYLSPSIIIASIWQSIFHGPIGNIIIAPYPFKSMGDSHFLLLLISACLILPPWFLYAAHISINSLFTAHLRKCCFLLGHWLKQQKLFYYSPI